MNKWPLSCATVLTQDDLPVQVPASKASIVFTCSPSIIITIFEQLERDTCIGLFSIDTVAS
jgi:hypothetical protein